VVTFKRALGEARTAVASLERDLADHVDRTTRAATAAEIEQMAVDLEQLPEQFDPLFATLADIGKRAAAAQIFDGVNTERFATASREQIPGAITVLVAALRYHRDSVLAGTARAVLLKPPEPTAPAVAEILPPTTRVFAVRNISWHDHKGKLRTCGRYLDANLPPAIARHAIEIGAAREPGDDFWKAKHGSAGWAEPAPGDCLSLDPVAAVIPIPRKPEPAGDPQFVKMDRGQPFMIDHREKRVT
jgi:hypothetical protein